MMREVLGQDFQEYKRTQVIDRHFNLYHAEYWMYYTPPQFLSNQFAGLHLLIYVFLKQSGKHCISRSAGF